jgi:hypothetical protein
MSGILAIWNSCTEGREAAYEDWYQSEHLPERIGIPGFLVGRRYEAVDARLRFLTTYEVEHPDVLKSVEYLERLNSPTERTTDIMKNGFQNMCRTACTRAHVRGAIRGAVVVTATLREADPLEWFAALKSSRDVISDATHDEVWVSSEDGRTKAAEESLRGGDEKIAGCVCIEYLRKDPALRLAEQLRRNHRNVDVGVYQLMCSLTRGE